MDELVVKLTKSQIEELKNELRKEIKKELFNFNTLINTSVVVIENHNNGGYRVNNVKFIGKAYNRMVKILHKLDQSFYLTDFFIPEYMDINNDYIYYGFLKLCREDFKVIIE